MKSMSTLHCEKHRTSWDSVASDTCPKCQDEKAMTDIEPCIRALRRGCRCLYIAVEESVADDIKRLAEAVITWALARDDAAKALDVKNMAQIVLVTDARSERDAAIARAEAAEARAAALEIKLADMTADYFRRHKDAVDYLERAIAAEARADALERQVEGLREALDRAFRTFRDLLQYNAINQGWLETVNNAAKEAEAGLDKALAGAGEKP